MGEQVWAEDRQGPLLDRHDGIAASAWAAACSSYLLYVLPRLLFVFVFFRPGCLDNCLVLRVALRFAR